MINARPLAVFLLFGTLLRADWNQFRGPNGTGIDSSSGYPVEFSPQKNAAWKASIPFGQSSPVVAAGRVYVTASDGDKLITICFDARSGRESWRREIKREHKNTLFRANDPASPTPAADEKGVYTFFPDFGLVAYAPDGKERWQLRLGPFKNFYGMAGSPALAGDLLVLVCDQQSGSFLIAIDRNTGKQRWRTERKESTISWTTPVVFHPSNGPAELVVLGSTRIDSYYLATGEPHWWTPIGSMGAIGVPAAAGDSVLIATAGTADPWMPTFESMLAKYDKNKDGMLSNDEFKVDPDLGEHFGWIDANSDGLVTAEEWNTARKMGMGPFGAIALHPGSAKGKLPDQAIQWRFQKGLPMIPAPLVYNDVYYMVRDGGIVTALSPSNGALLKQGRSPQALGEYYASPVAADGKIFLANGEGKITVLKAGANWEVLALNDMGEEVHATPALSDGRIYVRTRTSLYCFGASR
jgi:outer membrane protein assembly factor BamB